MIQMTPEQQATVNTFCGHGHRQVGWSYSNVVLAYGPRRLRTEIMPDGRVDWTCSDGPIDLIDTPTPAVPPMVALRPPAERR